MGLAASFDERSFNETMGCSKNSSGKALCAFAAISAFVALKDMRRAFYRGFNEEALRKNCMQNEKHMREQMNEKQVDAMVEDSFPASDAPSTY